LFYDLLLKSGCLEVIFFFLVRIRKFPFFHFASLRSKMQISGRMRGFIHFQILETSPFASFSEKTERRFFSKTISDFRALSGVRAQLKPHEIGCLDF